MRNLQAMLAAPLVLLWMVAGNVEGQADGGFWWLKETTDVPSLPPPSSESPFEGVSESPFEGVSVAKKPPCECVEYYLCVNGTISTSGVGLIDVRIGANQPPPTPPRNRNANQCPNLYDVCCDPPATTTTPGPTTTPEPTLPPDTPCECVSFFNCTGERIVNDGKGNTSLEAFGIFVSHSSCPHAITVCCALDPTTIPTQPTLLNHTLNPGHPHCDCVEPHQCDATGTIVTSGAGLLDLRTMYPNPNPSIECEDHGQMCCNIPQDELSVNSSSSSINLTPTTLAPNTVTPTTPNSCGSRHELGVAVRIRGFSKGESQFGEFPWVAAILRREILLEKPVHLFVGGGTLIHSRIVITAAHKVKGIEPSKIWVRLGEWDTQTTYEAHAHQNIQVEEVVVHPDFEPRPLFNDIALLILKEEAQMAPHISHICLTENISQVDTSACVINGWGKNGFEDTGTYQTIMKSSTLPMVDNSKCQNRLRKTRLGRYFQLHPSFVCAGGELGVDACTGDGGGPLACPRIDDPKRYLLVGMTAWGIGCGQDGIPGVYVSIIDNYHWILNETYGRYPTPTTVTSTTPMPSTTPLASTMASAEFAYDPEEYDYSSDYEEWREEIKNQREERKRRRKQLRKERKQREKEEKRRRREGRRRHRDREEDK